MLWSIIGIVQLLDFYNLDIILNRAQDASHLVSTGRSLICKAEAGMIVS